MASGSAGTSGPEDRRCSPAPRVRITIAKIEYHRFTMGTNHLPMNARAMLVFAEVVASGSFSEAARRLRLSKPSRMEESQ